MSQRTLIETHSHAAISGWGLMLVIVLATLTRTLFLNQIPQGASLDEVLTFRNTLQLLERPFDPFGYTPLTTQGWVETSNLYLYFNALIVKLFGVSYFSLKLFSAIPGIIACGFFYAACTRLLPPKQAVAAAMLMVFSHWHVRLSRYGWDASFLIMTLAATVWLLVWSFQDRPRLAWLAGVAMGAGMYSYIAARLCLVSLVAALAIIALLHRKRQDWGRLGGFTVGALISAAPVLLHYLRQPATTWVRVNELSVTHDPHPVQLALKNLWWHALMFHVRGGVYARDNYPGVPMLDFLTGVLLLIGLVMVIRHLLDRVTILLLVLSAGAMAGGIFSVSMEGPPYVYRVSPVIVPVLLIAGLGLEHVLRWMQRFGKMARPVAIAVICVIALVNSYMYFALEQRSISARRVMGAEYRRLGQVLRQTNLHAYVVVPGALSKPPPYPQPGERYYDVNHNFPYDLFGDEIAYFAVLSLSGRYDTGATFQENLKYNSVTLVSRDDLSGPLLLPTAIVLHASDSSLVEMIRQRYASDRVRSQDFFDEASNRSYTMLTITP
jgi:4-amino-4-deoxy-L-arabinose transferase-like glycosyltransferase